MSIENEKPASCQTAVSSRTFQGFDENGLLKITAKARTMEEAIQTAYDIFGDKVTIWNFKWLS